MESGDNNNNDSLCNFIEVITHRKYKGSYQLAIQTCRFLKDLVQSSNSKNVRQLFLEIKRASDVFKKIDSTETVVENIIQRIFKIILDESLQKKGYPLPQEKLIFFQTFNKIDDNDVIMNDFKDSIVMSINELMSEVEASGINIAKQSLDMIHTSEIIMTIGRSKTVELYLKYAATHKRKFQVIVAECAPFCNGHDLAASLAAVGISTLIIPDSSIFSVMNRVNKVVIGTHSIMSNGGIKAVSGSNTLALAAKHYSVPFIVCTGAYKLNTEFEDFDQLAFFNKFSSPQEILNYQYDYSTKCQIVNPVFDYVPPELISNFATNVGGVSPSFVYKLLRELYLLPDELETLNDE